VVNQPDGTVTVLMDGGSPLVWAPAILDFERSGGRQRRRNPHPLPPARFWTRRGNDITSQIQGGKLAGLLDTHNRVLASLVGDGQQAGSLNQSPRHSPIP